MRWDIASVSIQNSLELAPAIEAMFLPTGFSNSNFHGGRAYNTDIELCGSETAKICIVGVSNATDIRLLFHLSFYSPLAFETTAQEDGKAVHGDQKAQQHKDCG